MPELKEPHFFTFSEQPAQTYVTTIWRFHEYLSLFELANDEQKLGEASTSYLYRYDRAIPHIKNYYENWRDLKILILLRNPIERAISHYTMLKFWSVEFLRLEEAINPDFPVVKERMKNELNGMDYIGYGMYSKQVKAYLDEFPHVKIYLSEDLEVRTLEIVEDTLSFLGVDDPFTPDVKAKYNKARAVRSPRLRKLLQTPNVASHWFPLLKLIPLDLRIALVRHLGNLNISRGKEEISEQTKRYLKDIYAKDILELQDIIGRDLSPWLK